MEILAGIILLGVLVTFHELGHFLFAKWLGVRVLVFSVGFGPKLFGFKKGETEYRLSAIPLGGYVRMFGESLSENLSAEEKRMSFMHQAIWRKSLIAFAGPLFNFILPIVLFFFLLVGAEQVFAPKIGTLAEGGVAEKAGLLPDDLIVAVSGTPVETFTQVADIIAAHPNEDVLLTVKRGSETQNIKVRPEAKISNNPLEKDHSVGRIGIMPAIELPVVVVTKDSPLAALGLRDLDTIKRIGGHDIESKPALFAALLDLGPNSIMEVERKSPEQKLAERISFTLPAAFAYHAAEKPVQEKGLLAPEEMKGLAEQVLKTKTILHQDMVERKKHLGLAFANGFVSELTKDSVASRIGLSLKDRIIAVDGEKTVTAVQLSQAIINNPKSPHIIGVVKDDGTPLVIAFTIPEALMDHVGLDTDVLAVFGIKTASVFKAGEVITRHVGVLEAFSRACSQTVDIAWLTVKSIWLMIKREVPASQIGGPIMLFDVAQQAAKKGLSYYIFIMCLLSVNLGLLNLLPIPALDGGHLLLFGIEAVQRKPLTERTRAMATQIGIAILLSIMAFAIWNDLARLFR